MNEILPISTNTHILTKQKHYSFVTNLLIDLFLHGELPNIRELTIEPEYGYAGRLVYQNSIVRMFKGSDVGVNSSAAKQIAGDKGYTKHFLQTLGYQTPPGRTFLLPHYMADLSKHLSKYSFTGYALATPENIDEYIITTIGYPCFIKPNNSSRGKGVNRCQNRLDIEKTLEQFQKTRFETILVEKAIPWPDYRVVIYKNELIACYLRTPLSLIGDGKTTIRELLQNKRQELIQAGRMALIDLEDERITRQLARKQYELNTILPEGEIYQVYEVSNLSTGGDLIDFTDRIHPYWRDLCIGLVAEMGLHLCGVDFACADIEQVDPHIDAKDNPLYSILELNDSPGLANYAVTGTRQYERVKNLYKRILAQDPFQG